MTWTRTALAVTCLATTGACSKNTGEISIEPAPVVSAEALATGQKLYAERCVQCHGVLGRGDGPAAPRPRPTNLSDRVWQSNVTNARLRAVLVSGGGAVGKSALMPPNPDLAKRPEDLDGLIAVVRGLMAK